MQLVFTRLLKLDVCNYLSTYCIHSSYLCYVLPLLASAYTEAYNVCSVAVAPPAVSARDFRRETACEEDQGRTSEEEEGGSDSIYDRQVSSDKVCVLYLCREF